MVFLATKAALAASIIGITIGAVSFFAAQAGNQNNNGAPTQNRGVGTSSSSASTDSPLQLLFSGTASAGSGGFRLFETPPDCNCTVLTDCPHIGRRGFGIFRRTRTCGFHGFRRQICCDPKYITEQDLRLQLQQQPLFSARRRRPQRPPQQSPPRFLSTQQHPHIHADVNCKHASVQQCDCAIVQPQPDGSKNVENVASSFRSDHDAEPPPGDGDAKSTSESTTTITSTSTTMSTTASVTPVDAIDTTEAVGLLDSNLAIDPPSLRDLFADDENETESMTMTEKNVENSSNNENSTTSEEERVGPFIYNGTFPSLSEFFSSNENVASGDINRDSNLSYSLEMDEEKESVTAATTTEEPAATLELEDIGTGNRGSPRPLSLELDYNTVNITGRRVPPLPSVLSSLDKNESSPQLSKDDERVIVDLDMDDDTVKAEVEPTTTGPEVTTEKFLPADDDSLQSHSISPDVEATTVTLTPEAETTMTLVISTTTELTEPVEVKAATTTPAPTTTELPVSTDSSSPEAEVTTLTPAEETLPTTTTTDSSLSYRNDRKDGESDEESAFDPEIINNLEALDEEPILTTTPPAIPTTTLKSGVSLEEVDADVDVNAMTTPTATTTSTMLPEGDPNSGGAATSKPLILGEQHISAITTDATDKSGNNEGEEATTPTTPEESTIAQVHTSDVESETSIPISSITTDKIATNDESGDGGKSVEASVSTTPTTPEESTVAQVHISDKEDVARDDTDSSSLPTTTKPMSTSMLGLRDEAETTTATTSILKEDDAEVGTTETVLTTTTAPAPETNDDENVTTSKMTPLADEDGDIEIATTTTEGSSSSAASATTETSESFTATSTEMPEIITTTMSIAAYHQAGQVQGQGLSTTLAADADAQEGTTTVPVPEDILDDLTSATVPATAETFTTTEAVITSTTVIPEMSNEPEAPKNDKNDGDSDEMDFLTTTNLPTTTSTEASIDSNFSVKAILRNGTESLKLDFNLNEDVDVSTEKVEETTTFDKPLSSTTTTTEQESADATSEVTTTTVPATPTTADSEYETTTARIHESQEDPAVDRFLLLPTTTITTIMLNDLPEATTIMTTAPETDSVDPDAELDHTENPTTPSPLSPTTTLATNTASGESENFEGEVVGTTTNLSSILNTESPTLEVETTTSAAAVPVAERDEPETETEATTQTSGSIPTESVVTTTTATTSEDSVPEPTPTFQDEENLPLTTTTIPESTTVGGGGESNDEKSAARDAPETETEATTQTSGSGSQENVVKTTTVTSSEDSVDREMATSTPESVPTPTFQDEENLPLTTTITPESSESTTVGGGGESNDEESIGKDEAEAEAATQTSGFTTENVITTTNTATLKDSVDREVANSTSAPEPVPTFQDEENMPLTTTTTPESTTNTVGGGGESNDEEVEVITTTTEGITTTTTSSQLNDDDSIETFSSMSDATTVAPEVESVAGSTTESINQENLAMNDEEDEKLGTSTTAGTKVESVETTTENLQDVLETISKDEEEIESTTRMMLKTTTMKPEALETTTFDPEPKMGQDENEKTMTTTLTPDEVVSTEHEKEAEINEIYSDKAVKDPEESVIEIEQMSGTTTESVPESTTEIGTTPHGRKIPSGEHILITDTNDIEKVKGLKESSEVDVDVENETVAPEVIFEQEDDVELKTTTPEIVMDEEEATTSSTSSTSTTTAAPLTTTETEAPLPPSTTTISPDIITETGPPVTSRSRTSVVTMSSRVVHKVFVNSSQSRSDTNYSRSEFTSTTELPTSTTDIVSDTTMEYEFQEEGSGEGQNDEINPTTEIADYETSSITLNDNDAVGEDVTTTTVAPEIQSVQTTTENFFNEEPTESYTNANVSGESGESLNFNFEFDTTATTEFVVFAENSTTTTEKIFNETEIERDDETINNNKEENDLELVFETSTGKSTTEPGDAEFNVTETNETGFENLTDRYGQATEGPGESLVWKLETTTEQEQEQKTETSPTMKETRTKGENPVKELKVGNAQIERLPMRMTNHSEQTLLDEENESLRQVTTETVATTTESAGETEVNYDDLVTETELPELVTDIPNKEIPTFTNSVESGSESTIRIHDSDSYDDGESNTISTDTTQEAETLVPAPTTEIGESTTESSTTSSLQPEITSSTSTTTEKPEDSEFSDFLNSLSPRRAPALVKSSSTATTTEAPFKVEVKVGPYNSRALFSSDSTPEEKALEGEISNVVSQLLLTTHKNFHLLPSFVECAGARGRSGRRKTKVLHFDTDNYPWMARIGYREPRGVLFPCAGTIISWRYILTSANCASRKSNYANGESVMEILLEGAKNAAAGVSDQPWYKYKVEEVIVHPEYDNITRENDLALIRLTQEIPPFNGSSEVKPICLPFEDGYGVWDSLPVVGDRAYLGGWGYGLKNMAATIDEMEEAAVTIWPKDNCTYLYRGDLHKRITSKHICAYGKAEKDACRGDAGGPLMALMTRQKIFFQIGIVSYGPRCGYGVPAVYTRVNSYLSWILDSMRP